MPEFLIWQVVGPMAAWGPVAVGERRPSEARPSRTAVLGLVAGALGIERSDDETLLALDGGYGLGVRVERAGHHGQDYQTVQAPPRKYKGPFETRGDELTVPEPYTVQSWRAYEGDGAWLVALWPWGEAAPYGLSTLAGALKQPHFAPYLGRKAYPPQRPFAPQAVAAEGLDAAFDTYAAQLPNRLGQTRRRLLAWEPGVPGTALNGEQEIQRYDRLLSRRRWQFAPRPERVCHVTAGATRPEEGTAS